METEKEKVSEVELRSQFEASEDLRAEFGDDFECFVAFSRVDLAGRVRLCTPKRCSMMSVADFHNSQELTRLPVLLSFKDKERTPVDEERLKTKFEKSESLKSEFGDIQSFLEFKSKVVVQVLENYIKRAAGGGDRRREFAAKVVLKKCR